MATTADTGNAATDPSPVKPSPSGDGTPPRRHFVDWGAGWMAVLFGAMAIGMAFSTVVMEQSRSSNESSAGSLAGLLLFGVLTFFFALAALIGVFRALGLHQANSALGMPQGSIRAFMALVLIMLFFLMAVFLYLDVARTGTDQRLTGIARAELDTLVSGGTVTSATPYTATDPEDPNSTVELWDVTLRAARERSQIAEEIARQLVTVLGTLIVAIASFYFGTNSVQAATEAVKQDGRGEEHLPDQETVGVG